MGSRSQEVFAMLERFKAGYEHLCGLHDPPLTATGALPLAGKSVEDDDGLIDQHEAVLELLVATMFADATVADREFQAIDAYGEEQGWNTPTFSFSQSLGSATAKVRDARETEGGLDALLAATAARITDPTLRNEAVHACRLVAAADGTTAESESAWLASVSAALA